MAQSDSRVIKPNMPVAREGIRDGNRGNREAAFGASYSREKWKNSILTGN